MKTIARVYNWICHVLRFSNLLFIYSVYLLWLGINHINQDVGDSFLMVAVSWVCLGVSKALDRLDRILKKLEDKDKPEKT